VADSRSEETLAFSIEMSERFSDMAGVRDRLVLGYHAVSDVYVSQLTVYADALRQQVSELLGQGYEGTTFNSIVRHAVRRRRLAVTFDDGEGSVSQHAFPVLAELGVPATVFVVSASVGDPGLLGWDELAELARAGWEVGSHTVCHARLPELDDVALDAELRDSRRTIEDMLGLPCRSIAYPYGASDQRVRSAAARAGYTAGCTTGGPLDADALGWPRVGVDGHDGRVLFRAKTSPLSRRLRATPLGAPLARTGRALRGIYALRPK